MVVKNTSKAYIKAVQTLRNVNQSIADLGEHLNRVNRMVCCPSTTKPSSHCTKLKFTTIRKAKFQISVISEERTRLMRQERNKRYYMRCKMVLKIKNQT
jgi:hypothetical protein